MNIEGQKLETHSVSFESISGYEESSISCTMPILFFFPAKVFMLRVLPFPKKKKGQNLRLRKSNMEPEINGNASRVVIF